MSFTIGDLLKLDPNSGIRSVAGRCGDGNVITSVNIMDNPDTIRWLKEGELLITTGYIFKDDPVFQVQIIKEMAQCKCSALGVKIKRYFEEIPLNMIQEAENVGLPLIEIPYEYSLSYISHLVFREIIKNQVVLLEKSDVIYKHLMNVMLLENDLDKLAYEVSSLVENPLLILDAKWCMLAFSDCGQQDFRFDRHLNLRKNQTVFPDAWVNEFRECLDNGGKSVVRELALHELKIPCMLWPIHAREANFGYICIFETGRKLNDIDLKTVEHASGIIAFEIIKVKEIEEIKKRARADFFEDLLSGRIDSANSGACNIAALYGLDDSKRYSCVVVKEDDVLPEAKPRLEKELLLLFEQTSAALLKKAVCISRSDLVIAFIQTGDGNDAESACAVCKEIVEELLLKINKKMQGLKITFGIGRAYNGILNLNKSFKEAMETIHIGKIVCPGRAVISFQELIVYHVLNSGTSRLNLESLYRSTVARLADFDKENNMDFIHTLEVFFKCRQNMSQSAKELHIHRNTLIYRIEKIKDVLKSDLEDAEELLQLQLGLKASRLLEL